MSYESIMTCTRDAAFQDRVIAGAMKEAIAGGPEFSESTFGEQCRRNPQVALNQFIWPLSVDNELDYAYALETGKPNPGGDRSVIPDDKIQAGVQHWWPTDPLPMPLNPPTTVVPPPPPSGQVTVSEPPPSPEPIPVPPVEPA